MKTKKTMPKTRGSFLKPMLWILALVVLGAAGTAGWMWWSGSHDSTRQPKGPTYTVSRGDLTVTVSAGGTIQAMESYDVTSEVEGRSQILYVIPEGTVLTEEDVEKGTVLVRLDSSSLEEKVSQQQIAVQDAMANLTQAREDLAIQKQENESNSSKARLNVKFADLELQRYLGKELALSVSNNGLDFTGVGSKENLGGEAKQQKRELEAAVMLADEELSRAEDTLEWTRRLVERGYVNRNEEVADELKVKRQETEVQKARAELDLFLRYTLPKQAEQRFEDLREMKREQERVKARCRSELAQAESKLRSRQSTYELKNERLKKIQTMIENSVIRAKKTGLVVYASTINPRRYRNNPIQEGTEIREGQTIISIPDLSTLGARVEINETEVKSVRVGQRATITVEAITDETWEGEVARVSPMAKSEHRWLNPNVMVYDTDVALAEPPGEIKPGMSATTEIVVADLEDVVSVPVQAVQTRDGHRVCWVTDSDRLHLQEVQTGHFTATRVEIQRGLEEGDEILLAPPVAPPSDTKVATLPPLEGEMEGTSAVTRETSAAGSSARPGNAPAQPERGRTAQNGDERGRSGNNLNPERLVAVLREMEPDRRKKVIERIRGQLSSMPEDRRRQIQQKLNELTEESTGDSR